MADTQGIFQIIDTLFDNATKVFISSKSESLIIAIKPLAVGGVGLFLTCYGYLIMAGKIQEPFKDFLFKGVKIIVIIAFALNTLTYLDWVVKAINGLQSGLASALGSSDASSIFAQLDKTFDTSFKLVNTCIQRAATVNEGDFATVLRWYFTAGLIAAATLAVVLAGGFIILSATVLLKIMLAVGPLFIICLCWPITAKFFESWFRQTLQYVLKIVFIAIVMTFANGIFNRILDRVDFDSPENGLLMAFQVFIVGYLLYKIALEVVGSAARLSQGMSISAMGVSRTAAAAAPSVQVTSSIDQVAPPPIGAPAYRQYVIRNMNRN